MPASRDPGHRFVRTPGTWLCYLLIAFFTFLINIQGNIIPFLKQELALDYRTVSLHASALAAGMIVTGFLGDRIARRLGRGRVLRLGGAVCILGAGLLCLAHAAWLSIAACGLIGLGGSLIPSIVPATLARIHGPGRDIALTEASALCYVFAIAAPLTTGLAISLALGWRAAILAGAATGVVILVGLRHATVPETAGEPRENGRLGAAFWHYWCLLGFGVAVEYCVLLWAPTFLQHDTGMSAELAAVAAVAFPVAVLAGRTLGSRLVRRIAPTRLMTGSIAIAALGFAAYWGSSQPLPTVAGLFLLGLGTALFYPMSIALAIEAAGASSATASARFMIVIGLAIAVMPAVLGTLADTAGLHQAHLIVPALLAAALASLTLASRASTRPDLPDQASEMPLRS